MLLINKNIIDKNKKNSHIKEYRVQIVSTPKNLLSRWSFAISIITILISGGSLFFSFFQYNNAIEINNEKDLKAQAQSISSWIEENNENNSIAALNNLSNAPIYDIVVTVVQVGNTNNGLYAQSGLEVREEISKYFDKNIIIKNGAVINILPPGKYKVKIPSLNMGMSHKFGVEIAFRDSKGNSWITSANGHLSRIYKDPFKYYKLSSPMDFTDLQNQ